MSNTPEQAPNHGVYRIGTRGSQLALWQAHTIEGQLKDLGIATEITIIKTRGDRIDDIPFSKLEGKNFFTKELEDAQLEGRVDFAVHSLKDLATDQPDGLVLTAMVGREDARELLLAHPNAVDQARLDAGDILPLRDGVRIGTSAARRQAQIHHHRPDLNILDLRGNVPTRVNKLRDGNYDAILLARAGVMRLELELDDLFTQPLPADGFVPAPAQGMMGIQCRDEEPLRSSLARLHCADDGQAVVVERMLLEKLEGGCQLPFGVNVRRDGDQWRLDTFLAASAQDDKPLRLNLVNEDLDALANAAWTELKAFRDR